MTQAPASSLSISDVARLLGVAPRVLSKLFYDRVLPEEWAPIQGGNRLIDPTRVEDIAAALRKAGKLPQPPPPSHP